MDREGGRETENENTFGTFERKERGKDVLKLDF